MTSVRWMPKEEILFLASHLLESYGSFVGKAVVPPVPIEDIVERFLKISLEYSDLKALLNLPDTLGALWINERRIVIDKCRVIQTKYWKTTRHQKQ